ncbi:MBL fold metallo-hydrolase [Nocardia alni]|uniref:MBL fold metallo-hydrolase n=1 Tax=Nocardia alni TaxID=2815723 RepID=UPI001C22BC08|nr:MBL fold metallo-hydrolase [Nocardia alni]
MSPADFQVGSVRVHPILDGHMGVAPHVLYPFAGPDDLAAEDRLDEDGNVPLDYGGYLLSGRDDAVVLVDTGGGESFAVAEDKGRLHTSGLLVEQLERAGVAPADVTHVVFTHLHFDHCGGASSAGRTTFPHAQYVCHEEDWRWFVIGEADPRVRTAMEPTASQVRTWTTDTDILPWLRVVHCPGHTPGNSIVFVSDQGAELALIGDLAHHPLEFTHPGWLGGVDADPSGVVHERMSWFGRFADAETPIASTHFPDLRPITIERAGQAFRESPSLSKEAQ